MKRSIFISLLLIFFAFGMSSRIGIKPGINYGVLNSGDNNDFTGIGLHFGLGMGIDYAAVAGIDITPSFRSTKYSDTEKNGGIDVTTTCSFSNLYLPLVFSLKPEFLPSFSPFLGLGAAGNFQLSGKVRFASNGNAYETEIEDLENDLYLIISLGGQINSAKFKFLPEVSFNYNLTADDPDTQNNESNYDIHCSFGLYYSP